MLFGRLWALHLPIKIDAKSIVVVRCTHVLIVGQLAYKTNYSLGRCFAASTALTLVSGGVAVVVVAAVAAVAAAAAAASLVGFCLFVSSVSSSVSSVSSSVSSVSSSQ